MLQSWPPHAIQVAKVGQSQSLSPHIFLARVLVPQLLTRATCSGKSSGLPTHSVHLPAAEGRMGARVTSGRRNVPSILTLSRLITESVPFSRQVCPLGWPNISPWVTKSVPLGGQMCSLGSPNLSPWVAKCVPLGRRICPLGSPNLSPWLARSVPVARQGCPLGSPNVFRCATSVPLGQQICPLGSPNVFPWVTKCVPLGHQICPLGSPGLYGILLSKLVPD